MSQIDATGLTNNYSVYESDHVDHASFVGGSPDFYTWQTTGSFFITALSFSGDLAFPAFAGTVDAINIVSSSYSPMLSIAEVDIPLATLIDTVSDPLMQEDFWEAVLAGVTDVLVPTTPGQFLTMVGDHISVNAGLTRAGAGDIFLGVGVQGSGSLVGDAFTVEAAATLNAGNDVFDQAVASTIIGDVGHNGSVLANFGILNGGDDAVTITDLYFNPTLFLGNVIGDVDINAFGGEANGGDDSVTLKNLSFVSGIYGDAQTTYGTLTGGNDDLLVETDIGRTFTNTTYLIGDAGSALIYDGGGTFTANGGDDEITARNIGATYVSGDLYLVDGILVCGGDDTIDLRSTTPAYTIAPPYQVTPFFSNISGDTYSANGAQNFTGGDDDITMTNIIASNVSGDALFVGSGSTLPQFFGGNDTIIYTYNRTNSSAAFEGHGDSIDMNALAFTGGDDSITANLINSLSSTTVRLYGDTENYYFSMTGGFTGGDDVLFSNTGSVQNAFLFGDSGNLSGSGTLNAAGGNDTITAGAGNDVLFGDWEFVSSEGDLTLTGGNDVLDGRGGNDTINGGDGNDTALFALPQSVYVDLQGIPGSAAAAADWLEAVGQGNDQLIGVENVTTASKNDTIFGNGVANVLAGGGGVDLINGRDGNDTLLGGAGADQMFGGNGDDVLQGGDGGDALNGGANRDRATYSDATSGVTADLQTPGSNLGYAFGDTYNGVEDLFGSSHADTLRGDGAGNQLFGSGGADLLSGRGGADTLNGGAAADRFDFNSVAEIGMNMGARDVVADFQQGSDLVDLDSIDALTTAAGVQHFTWLGGAAHTGAGATLRYQQAGGNTLLYADVDANGGADFTLEFTGLFDLTTADFTALSITSILGTNAADTLTGGPGGKTMTGLDGNDTITGGTGNDTIFGGNGADSITGGLGADIFDLNSITHSGATAGTRDIVTDFQQGVDLIDLFDIDANTTVAGNQAFVFLGTAAHTGAGATLRYQQTGGNTVIFGDTNADAAADFSIQLTGLFTLVAGDFVL